MSDSEFTAFLREIRDDIRDIKRRVEKLERKEEIVVVRKNWYQRMLNL